MQNLRIANLQGIFCVDLQYLCKPVIALVLTLRRGGRNPINTSIELVDLFTIFYFPLLRERVRVRGLFVYTSGGIL